MTAKFPSQPQAAPSNRFKVLLSFVNDPSAGSPTETLLRLLLPLSDKVYLTSRSFSRSDQSRMFTGSLESVGATGGVYKGQGRNQYKLMTCTY
jgi:hypothetical protein